jgi:hypothetical protein
MLEILSGDLAVVVSVRRTKYEEGCSKAAGGLFERCRVGLAPSQVVERDAEVILRRGPGQRHFLTGAFF